ncbi:MAG: class D beta-lactamase [Clostridiales bacterium]|nr:class D beta-lactamase [Clostridiales bacterium]
MKKILTVFFVLFSMLLCGCSEKQDNEIPMETKQPEPSDPDSKQVASDKKEDMTEEIIDLSNSFNGINGCAVIYDPTENKCCFYNEALAKQEASPYSTFKIISTLAGLHNNVIKDQTTTMDYTGTQYPNLEWNKNLTLEEAFQTSCIWYFHQVINAIGKAEMQSELKALEYGNQNISEWEGNNINPYEELNGFWLNSSLKISPLQQVKVLEKIFEGESIYRGEDVEILKEIMLVQENEAQKTYGKTGSGSNGEAWFVGFTKTNEQSIYFAIYLNDPSKSGEISGSTAREIALKIMQQI